MFKRILIANRGEIALRVIRACREMGVESVVVYSTADADAPYLELADEAICIGPPRSAHSYLDIPRIISAAEIADVEAVHPGYGFLSENSHFAEVCGSCKIVFIGPSPETIALVGDKARARQLAEESGLPVIPGSKSIVENEGEAMRIAHELGYPVMIKAAAGGGGRGMRMARNDVSLINGFLAAQAEAEAAFKNSSVYIEKLIERPRHVEVQVLADAHGKTLYLGERDCSLQRRHQKLIEEAPSPAVGPELRRRMGEAAVTLCRAAGYVNAGTVEFLLDREGRFYFMEVNARVQVEHPVTEMVTGIDIIKEQIRVAAGEPLAFSQEDVCIRGAAIEARINAEDPEDGFRPGPGRIESMFIPGGPGVRFDSHACAGYVVSPHYDSMIGKLIVCGATRPEAVARMTRALDEFLVEGIPTTIGFYREVVRHPDFHRGEFDTTFIESHLASS
ncbi:MAG: acetyl-CoA carboxylase biotin carboxylase subunit [Planctomycetota bacterium]